MNAGQFGVAELEVGGRRVRVTTPGRVLWPATGYSKREMVDYYLAVAPVLLEHLRARPVMLWRFPEGVDGPGWFQANCRGAPSWVPIHEVRGRRGELFRYCIVEEAGTLVWLANLGTIELHPFLWTVDRPIDPTAIVIDLDPGPPAGLVECSRVALEAREMLAADGLVAAAKTSGGLGIHVFAGLAPGHTFVETKAYARRLGRRLAARLPDLMVERSARAERRDRVYVDWVQNDANRQIAAPYSLRATPIPCVSAPVEWHEVEAAAGGDPTRLRFGPAEVRQRVERDGDLFASVLDRSRRLPTSSA